MPAAAPKTWGDVAAYAYPDVLTEKCVLFERRIFGLFKLTVVLALVIAVIDGHICGYASEASQPIDSPLTVAFGPAPARAELRRRLGL